MTAGSAPPGVDFPEMRGSRPSTPTATGILADAAGAVDPMLADDIEAATDWRSDYIGYFTRITALGADPGAALAIADAGLDSLRRRIVLGGGVPLAEAKPGQSPRHATATVVGGGEPVRRLTVPYRGGLLEGAALRAQLHRWLDAGIVEPGFVGAIEVAIDHPEILRIPGHQVVLVGAGAEMGPLGPLTAWGADLLALDVPTEGVWRRIRGLAESGAGSVAAPVDGGAPGIDLIGDPAGTAAWIRSVARADRTPVLGVHGYADGGRHVLLTAAADIVGQWLRSDWEDLAVAYLGTPTDSYLVPRGVLADSRARWNRRGPVTALAQSAARTLTRGGVFRPAYAAEYDRDGWGVADILLPMQGPNYALAKRLQRWRALVTARDGAVASFNVAPASWTRSVTKNRMFKIAYSGAGRFGVEIFAPETVRWLFAAKLAADIAAGTAGAGSHPESLIYADANHGGFWRSPYEPKSVLGVSAVAGLPAALADGLSGSRRCSAETSNPTAASHLSPGPARNYR